jgi:opacity protein-like surface antigen
MHAKRIASYLVVAVVLLLVPRSASALINVGAEGGMIKRSADSPSNLKLGLAYGVHGEVSLLPLIKVGPYYLHYDLSSADSPDPRSADAVFNALGLRARFTLPIPGSYKPYAYAGAGYTWASYRALIGDQSGHFIETPLGVGLAYEVVEIFQLSLDWAYRPAFGFGGDAYEGALRAAEPKSGWSLMLGAAIDL